MSLAEATLTKSSRPACLLQLHEELRELRTLQGGLPAEELVLCREPGRVDYEAGQGAAFGLGPWQSEELSVQRVFGSAGAVVSATRANTHRYVVCYSGRFRVEFPTGRAREVRPGEAVYSAPGETVGELTALEDSWVLVVSVPGAEGYPSVPGTE